MLTVTYAEVFDQFLQLLPLPLSAELAPLAIMIKHEDECPARGGDESLCICCATLSAVSERLPDWRMSVVLPRRSDEVDADTVVFAGIH
jgi:hypothetical protein